MSKSLSFSPLDEALQEIDVQNLQFINQVVKVCVMYNKVSEIALTYTPLCPKPIHLNYLR